MAAPGKLIITATGRTPRCWDGPIFVTLDGASQWNLASAGVPTVAVTPTDYDEIHSQCLAVQG